MKVIITIPAYNEENTLPKVIDEINSVMKQTSYNYKILVWDDGSSDKTSKVAKQKGAIVGRSPRNMGLAETFRLEMSMCIKEGADIIVHTDADGQYPAKYIPKMINEVENGNDLVLGSRFQDNNYSGSFVKKLGNIAFSRAMRSLTRTKITDTTTGFRAFTKEVAGIKIINTFTYTHEQLIKASRQRFKISEISISTRKTRDSRLFSSPLQYALKAWLNIIRIYRDYDPLKFFGGIGSTLFGVGFLIGLYFVYLHLTSGIDGHLGLFFLMMLLLFTGLQIILFGFLADMNRDKNQ